MSFVGAFAGTFSKRRQLVVALLACGSLLASCGGGNPAPGSPPGVTPTPTPTPSPACSLRARQDWAAAQLREWYLFPETLPASLDPAPYSTVDAYINALTATARDQGRDRFFTYLASIAEEDAFFASGATAAFGIRLQSSTATGRVFVADAYEGAPALAAGIDRGTEILAIGTDPGNLVAVSSLLGQGDDALSDAFGPSMPGVSRTLRLATADGAREVTITKAEFNIQPISPRFGTRTIDYRGKRIGYVNLRTFISPAEPALRQAFATLRAQGIREIVIDFRYNGGGLVSVAERMGDLLGENRFGSDVFSFTQFRPEKSSQNQQRNFQSQAQSISPLKIAFIGTDSTASASEIVMNGMLPWLGANAILVGDNTFGKPVGQIARDRAACDDRLRVVAFSTTNANRQGDYFGGMAEIFAATCKAEDDLQAAMGDIEEASTRLALDALSGDSCAAIAAGNRGQALEQKDLRRFVAPSRPSAFQRELPGSF